MYYAGINLGTSSVGWAVTSENYKIARKKGKDLWGVRMFDEAETAKDRRLHRTSRRRMDREKARIALVKEYFAEEIEKIDPGFYQRLEESKYRPEDKKTGTKYGLFADPNFTDKEYYEKYPTISHLRKELIESEEEHDVRLVFLAVLNLFKHRGHFLNAFLNDTESTGSIKELYETLIDMLPEDICGSLPRTTDYDKLEDLLGSKDLTKKECIEKITELFGLSKTKNKAEYEIVKMLCGNKGKLSNIFGKEVLGEEFEKTGLSFREGSCDETMAALENVLPEDYISLLENVKAVHDKGLLTSILKGYTYLSQARVASYEKHADDLAKLKMVIKKYCPHDYDTYFRVMADNNYSGYIGSVNSDKEKRYRNQKTKEEKRALSEISKTDDPDKEKESKDPKAKGKDDKAFWEETKRILNKMPETDETVMYLKKEIEKETLFPKQMTSMNSVIPNQVHLAELKKILSNAENYLPFLKEKDEYGLTVKERIIRLYQFQVPYYVGPLHVNPGEEDKKWVQRKEAGKVLPWNIEDKVDMTATRAEFITRMVRHCTYLNEQYVLPKNSMLYEQFMVLNELNNIRIGGHRLDVDLKQDIYSELFVKGKKVTKKTLVKYLSSRDIIEPDDENMVSGIDKEFTQTLASYAKFKSIFGEKMLQNEYYEMAEQIIFWGTVYSNDKKLMKKLIQENYGKDSELPLVDSDQLKRILGLKWKDWGRLSREFLCMKGCKREDGEATTLIDELWNTNRNMMELLTDDYTFLDTINGLRAGKERLLSEFTFDDLEGNYLSAPVKRMIWQTVLVLRELTQVLGEEPAKLFIEMPRTNMEKGQKTSSRKKKLESLLKSMKTEESKALLKELAGLEEKDLRNRKIYLYFTQMGRSMYTGARIALNDLINNTGMYNLDHIYPLHYVKDDSLENNLVLVERDNNRLKSDDYPLDEKIQEKQKKYWGMLLANELITKEKYTRLTRNWKFSDEELAGFISRQLVETGQASKFVAHLLEELLPETEIVYVKASNVTDFRQKMDILKTTKANVLHNAHDAYLSIVVGNVYDTKFTKSPLNFIKGFKRSPENYRYHLNKMYDFNVERNGVEAWQAGEHGTIATVRKMLDRSTPLVVKRTYEAHGQIADQTIYPAKKANFKNYIPVKASDERVADVTKYGGLSSVSGAYYFLVEHGEDDKRVRTLEQVPIYLKAKLESSDEALLEYCEKKLGLVNPDISMRKILMKSLVKRNGYLINIGGRSEKRIIVENGASLCLTQDWLTYIRRLENFKESGKEDNGKLEESKKITQEKNNELYQILLDKHLYGYYKGKPNPLGAELAEKKEMFENLSLKEQASVLVELLNATYNKNLDVKAQEIKLKKAKPAIGNKVSGQNEFLLINQSVTGIYTTTVDLLTV